MCIYISNIVFYGGYHQLLSAGFESSVYLTQVPKNCADASGSGMNSGGHCPQSSPQSNADIVSLCLQINNTGIGKGICKRLKKNSLS